MKLKGISKKGFKRLAQTDEEDNNLYKWVEKTHNEVYEKKCLVNSQKNYTMKR